MTETIEQLYQRFKSGELLTSLERRVLDEEGYLMPTIFKQAIPQHTFYHYKINRGSHIEVTDSCGFCGRIKVKCPGDKSDKITPQTPAPKEVI